MSHAIATPAPRVELRRIGLNYPGRHALHAIDLSVQPGELVSILGPSGSGKSTLLRIAAGLQKLQTRHPAGRRSLYLALDGP